jgi:hypothetical protein
LEEKLSSAERKYQSLKQKRRASSPLGEGEAKSKVVVLSDRSPEILNKAIIVHDKDLSFVSSTLRS